MMLYLGYNTFGERGMTDIYKILDLYCGGGGSAIGLSRVGCFEIIGIDIEPQPNYPFEFHLGDALTYPLEGIDAYWASPPCQGYSITHNLPWLKDKEYPLLIKATRERLLATGKPYIIENVNGARYHKQMPKELVGHGLKAGFLCGTMFGLPYYRHRRFETNFFWMQPAHPTHRIVIESGRMFGSRLRKAHDLLNNELNWMTEKERSQSISVAFSEYLGAYLLKVLRGELSLMPMS